MLTLTLLVLTLLSASIYTVLVLNDIRPGYKLMTFGGILGPLSGGLFAVHLSVLSLDSYLYLALCITATGVALTRGRPASLFDFGEIYGYDDPEAAEHDTGIWKRQAVYVLILLVEGAPVIFH